MRGTLRMTAFGIAPFLAILLLPLTRPQQPTPTSTAPGGSVVTPANSTVTLTPSVTAQRTLSPVSIEVAAHLRDYISGPIDGIYTLRKYDPILLYAGKLDNAGKVTNGKIKVRKWLLRGESAEGFICHIQRIYNFGERILYLCGQSDNYVAYMQDGEANETLFKDIDVLPPAEDPTYVIDNRNYFAHFDITKTTGLIGNEPSKADLKRLTIEVEDQLQKGLMSMSDPVDLIESPYCYRWGYRVDIMSRVGYVFKDSQPNTGFGLPESYLIVELLIWIIEPVTEHYKLLSDAQEESKVKVSNYAKLLTRRFHSKNLLPCLRKAHPAVELISDVVFVEERDSKRIETPHWKMELKLLTNSLVSTLDDISFTISSRQHAVLFNCFVGDVRAMVSHRDFNFIDEGQTDQSQIQWKFSKVDKTLQQFLHLKLKHIYGHGTVYKGPGWGESYQDGSTRTDAVVITNPCISQEFALIVAGRIYVVEEFLKDYKQNIVDVLVPGLEDTDDSKADPSTQTYLQQQHIKYYGIRDLAFTPTHLAILKEDSSVYLHPHSIYYQGFAYITAISKFRLDAFVKRKWCSKSSYMKTSNMLIPGFSRNGAIVFIQIFPTESYTNVHLGNRPNTCIFKNEDDTYYTNAGFKAILDKYVNETCIHQKETVKYSNEQGLPVDKDLSGCVSNTEEHGSAEHEKRDEVHKYILNFGEIFPDFDPHFPRVAANPALHKLSNDTTNYNVALIYKVDNVDVPGEKIEEELRKSGLKIEAPDKTTSGIVLHAMEFTAEDKRFLFAAEFSSNEVEWGWMKSTPQELKGLTMMVAVLYTRNLAARLYPTDITIEETLDTAVHSAGSFFVRSKKYIPEVGGNTDKPYITKLSTIGTAVPTYVVDLGDVVVFSSIEGRYARPLTYFTRGNIHRLLQTQRLKTNVVQELESKDRKTKFVDCNWPLSDFLLSEHGSVSVLRRRPENVTNNANSRCKNSTKSNIPEGQSIFIGSIHTLDSLREVRPFAAEDNIFQMTTPDGEIVFGKFTTQAFYHHSECPISSIQQFHQDPTAANKNDRSCFIQDPSKAPLCVNPPAKNCRPWDVLPECDSQTVTDCLFYGSDDGNKPINSPAKTIEKASMLNVQFNSLLNGNLQLVSEQKITEPVGNFRHIPTGKDNHICPFSDFRIEYIPFNFAEIGFSTRITALVSYFGILLPAEVDLLVEFDEEPGIQISTTSSVSQQRDEVTITKTIDIEFTLTDQELHRMKKERIVRTSFNETINLDREIHSLFSITIRPSIVNTKCNKEDFYTTIQYNVGCYPFNKMRLLAEATPALQKNITNNNTLKDKTVWSRVDNELVVHYTQVWHKQREIFKCSKSSKADWCKIPFANLFGDQVYDLSWRDPLVPKFEQFLSARARKVVGNVIVYNMLNWPTVMNISMLGARCYNNGSIPGDLTKVNETWYDTLQNSVTAIGNRSTEREDVYQYHVDCFDVSEFPRQSPEKLNSHFYRLINLTNQNAFKFDVQDDRVRTQNQNQEEHIRTRHRNQEDPIRTKNRNQIYILRAAVINTYFNRFTYCQLMDTFFMIRVTGISAPRDPIKLLDFAIILLILAVFFISVYLVFYKFYTWKLDIPAIPGTEEDPERTDGIPGEPEFGQVESDHMMKRLIVKVHALAKWRRKAQVSRQGSKNTTSVSASTATLSSRF